MECALQSRLLDLKVTREVEDDFLSSGLPSSALYVRLISKHNFLVSPHHQPK